MCLRPIKILNPWFCPHPIGSIVRGNFEKKFPLWFLHDTQSAFINVPCGMCVECRKARQAEFVQRCSMMSRYSWTLFGTLTYSNEAIPIKYVNGRPLKYADSRDFQHFIKRLRLANIIPPFRYLAVSEYGSDETKHHRPHFHFLFFIPKPSERISADLEKIQGFQYASAVLSFIISEKGWSRNYGDRLNPIYMPLSRFIKRGNKSTYDCQYVSHDTANVNFYVTKYVLKFSKYVQDLQSALRLNLSESEYCEVWRLVRPKLLTSNGLGIKLQAGFPAEHIDNLIDLQVLDMIRYAQRDKESPQFYLNGKGQPLSKYFQKKCLTLEQKLKFHYNKVETPFDDETNDQEILLDDFVLDEQKKLHKEENFLNLCNRLNRQKY